MKRFMLGCFLSVSFLVFSGYRLYAQELPGEITDVKGTVEILKGGETEWETAVERMPVEVNDRIKTAGMSSCNLELDDGSFIRIEENTEASVDTLELTPEKHTSKFSLWFGRLLANIAKSRVTKMQVSTPTSVAAVRGTEFAVEASNEKTNVGVFDGEVAVNTPDGKEGENVIVKPDEETSVAKGMRPRTPERLREAMLRHRERMLKLRSRVQILRERLKRVPPEKRMLARKRILERFAKIRANRATRNNIIRKIKREIRKSDK